jgi:chemotaxis protein CheD
LQFVGVPETGMSDSPPVELYLPAGHFHFGSGNVRVNTLLGTCIAIAVWHPVKRIGGMCHFLLPARLRKTAPDAALPGLYAQDVMGLFARALQTSGTVPKDYIVKVAGGGNMFPDQVQSTGCGDTPCPAARRADCQSIGCTNIAVARTLLADAGYSITSENVGGQGSRRVMFELWSGEVWVKRGASMTPPSRAVA